MNEKNKYTTIIHPLEPFYNNESKILILGSFPSVKTREYGFFYGHPQNRFWAVMENLFDLKLSWNIEERKEFLCKHKIALYDSIYQCDIIGSKDASIKNVVPTELKKIINTADIKEIFLNGGTSYKYYKKYHCEKLGFDGIKLPSTSPANARFSLEDLICEWSYILDYLK